MDKVCDGGEDQMGLLLCVVSPMCCLWISFRVREEVGSSCLMAVQMGPNIRKITAADQEE